MKTVAEHLIAIRENLSDKDRWERNWENNKKTGYSSGSLGNGLAGIFVTGGKKEYPAAYACVHRAIIELYGEELAKTPIVIVTYQGLVPEDWKYQPDKDHIGAVISFARFKEHEWLMNVLDLAIRYAKVWIFS